MWIAKGELWKDSLLFCYTINEWRCVTVGGTANTQFTFGSVCEECLCVYACVYAFLHACTIHSRRYLCAFARFGSGSLWSFLWDYLWRNLRDSNLKARDWPVNQRQHEKGSSICTYPLSIARFHQQKKESMKPKGVALSIVLHDIYCWCVLISEGLL